MNTKHLAVRAVAALAAATMAIGLAACGSTDAQSGAGGSSSTEILFGGDNGSPTFTKNFNPFSSSKRTGINFIYEPLMVVNSIDGTEKPFLATSHKIVNPKTVEYTIRSGVKWSDGQAFSADDVVYTFNLLKTNSALDTLGVWQHIASISASGDTVTFNLKDNDVPAVKIIDQQLIVPQHIWKSVKDPVKDTNATPVGTGPYKLGTYTPNQYTLTKNASYWQAGKVAATSIVFPASNKALDMVNKGYDWGYMYMNDVQKTWVGADKQHNHYWFPPGGTVSLFPNLTKTPYNNVNFRLGLSNAIDRAAIAKDAEEGYVDASTQTGLLLPNQKSWVNSSIPNSGVVKQSKTTALKYFAKAGYTEKGGKLVDSTGKQLTLTVTVPSGYSDWLRGIETLQTQLSAIGISVKLNQPQPAAYTQALNNGDYDLIVASFGGTGDVYTDYSNLLNGEFYQPVGTAASANFERYKNSTTDSLLAQLKATSSTTEQKEIVNQLQEVVYNQVPVVGMFYGGLWGLYSTKKFTGWPTEKNPYASPSTWTSQVLMVVTNLKKA
ncbi:MAG: ABC transporter substrate-binding protein [Bifidobacterium aquikefiri]|uniref:Peptide ABC transporter substrate-binding protein n=1 Tax=Bifidobacterium aquikefiri TaxID=1653207 RepID=A0A261G8R3_9BIFI|nr:ABC transporter substrate-binding protein [Bifidobacterium aquikefiri]OZG67593.1 peptide ABC transporter substrate-binding protein [Bifidobacterium aquikefiri]